MRVGFAAAGSGGHVFPALAVAEQLTRLGVRRDDVVFFGGDRMEATTIPDAGFPFVGVEIHGIRRRLSIDNVKLPLKVRAARDAISDEIRSRSLGAMVVFGGYISGPAALAARRSGVPLVVHEANAVPGVANRMVARRAEKVYVSFAPATDRLPGATVIGSPLRRVFSDFDRVARRLPARGNYGLAADDRVLGVVGGSLGARFLNDVASVLGEDPDRRFSIVHVAGTIHVDTVAARAAGQHSWHVLAFEDEMADLYAASDLILSRAGALTISELQATGTPAVVVPLPAGKGYQGSNAEDLVASGGGVIVPQSDPQTVADEVRRLLDDGLALEAMAAATPAVDHGRAAAIMANHILEVAHA